MKNSIEKKNLLLIAAVCLLISSCGTHSYNRKPKKAEYYTTVSIPPYVYKGQVEICSKDSCWSKDTCMQIDVSRLSNEEILNYFLRSEKAQVTVKSLNLNSSGRYGTVFISDKNEDYKVTLDYMNYRTVPSGKNFSLVGVGFRMTAFLHTNKAGITLGDINSIGFAANSDWLRGSLSLDVIGISSKDISHILPLPSEINQNSIQNAMQAFATIKSKIHDEGIKLTPHIFAYLIRTNDSIFLKMDSEKFDSYIQNEIDSLQQGNLTEQEDYLYLQQAAFDYLCFRYYDEALSYFKRSQNKLLQKEQYPNEHLIKNDMSSVIITLLEKPEYKDVLKEDSSKEKWIEIFQKIVAVGKDKLPASIVKQLNNTIQELKESKTS